MSPAAHAPCFLHMSPEDNVVVTRCDLAAGESVVLGGVSTVLDRAVMRGHKIACRPISKGDKVVKYGAPIGSATADIKPGEHVHLHNLASDYTPSHVIASTAGRTR